LNNLEKQTSVPKAYAFIGLVAVYFFAIVFNLGGQLLTNLAGFAIPGYYSLDALFSANKSDDTQWLTVSFSAWSADDTPLWLTCPLVVLGSVLVLHVSILTVFPPSCSL
jgi:hypothetical protein